MYYLCCTADAQDNPVLFVSETDSSGHQRDCGKQKWWEYQLPIFVVRYLWDGSTVQIAISPFKIDVDTLTRGREFICGRLLRPPAGIRPPAVKGSYASSGRAKVSKL